MVLVGHSYGGTVIAEAGRHPAVEHLVLISSYTPAVGLAQGAIMADEPDPVSVRLADGRVALDGYDVGSFRRTLPPGRRRRHATCGVRADHEPGRPGVRHAHDDRRVGGVDSTAIVCLEDRSTTVALQRAHAARATRSIELPTGHHPFITRPDLVVDAVEALLR